MKNLVEREGNVAACFTNLSPVLQNSHRPEFSAENAVRTTRVLAFVHWHVLVFSQNKYSQLIPNITVERTGADGTLVADVGKQYL